MYTIAAIWNWILAIGFLILPRIDIGYFSLAGPVEAPPTLLWFDSFFGLVFAFGLGFYFISKSITENTELTLDIKTLVIIISFVVSFVGMYFALQKDIDLAKELPKPQVTRTEYDLKDQLIRETIMNTQKKVEDNSNKLDKIDEKLYQIIDKK